METDIRQIDILENTLVFYEMYRERHGLFDLLNIELESLKYRRVAPTCGRQEPSGAEMTINYLDLTSTLVILFCPALFVIYVNRTNCPFLLIGPPKQEECEK